MKTGPSLKSSSRSSESFLHYILQLLCSANGTVKDVLSRRYGMKVSTKSSQKKDLDCDLALGNGRQITSHDTNFLILGSFKLKRS